jgi:8-oxo-dGTP pyrophosphatase MutT (NUDIX family)
MTTPGWLQPLADALVIPEAIGFLRPPLPEDPALRRAAVLILFGEGPDGPDVLLLRRGDDLRSHAGQVAFPGGQVDPDDDGAVGAALREAQEETGVDASGVEVFAVLPELWVPPSRHAVTPVVAWWQTPNDVGPGDPFEVAAVARVPISALVDPANRLSVRHSSGYVGPAFRVADMLVWGFTAGVLDRLLSLAGWDVGWDRDRIEPLPAQAG